MKGLKPALAVVGAALTISGTAMGGIKANVAKMHQMVAVGYEVVHQLGEEAFEGINDPNG